MAGLDNAIVIKLVRDVMVMETKNDAGQQKKLLSPSEQIEKLDKQIKQLKNKKQAIANREKERERKERTRRLIQNGAIAEKIFKCVDIGPAEFEKRLLKIVQIEQVKDLIE